jgi:drug/metabolite transporter (DMT)-like permease
MYSESDLEAAVAAGALTPDAAASLRDYVAGTRAAPAVDEEHFRLLTGFNDIFVAIAAVLLLVAVSWIGNSVRIHPDPNFPSPFAGLFVAATAWGLAEFFTRKRRMALPSIILLLAFVGGVFTGSGFLLINFLPIELLNNNVPLGALLAAGCAAIAAAAAWLHWQRFRVPITIAAGAAAVVGLVLALIASAIGNSPRLEQIMLGFALALGIGVFLFAMWWDSSDPRRETRRSDVAFWLHLLAAPLIVHPVFSLLGLTDGNASVIEAIVVLLVYVVLGLTALAIDRRALLVSALAYVLYALNSLFREYGAVELSVALTALVIGSALLLLSAFWHSARKAVVQPLPANLRARLPITERATATA